MYYLSSYFVNHAIVLFPKKVLKVDFENFRVKPIIRLKSKLKFYFKEGACGTFFDNNEDEFALLCFDRANATSCFKCTKEQLESGAECDTIESKPSKGVARNAIRLIDFEGKGKL